MGAGATTLSKDEAKAAAPGAGVAEFDDAAWESLEKDAEGKVSCETLKGVAIKYAAAPAEPAKPAEPPATTATPAEPAPADAPSDAASSVPAKYLHPDHPGNAEKIEHLAPGGFATGSFAQSVQAPESLAAAEKVLFKLHQVLSHEGDNAISGFGETYAAPTVNYHTMFKAVDLDGNRQIERDEWNKVMRRVLCLKGAELSDDELMAVYDAVDDNHNGTISLQEFAAFARGGRWTSPHHHQGHVRNTSWGLVGGFGGGHDDGTATGTYGSGEVTEDMPHYSDKKVTQKARSSKVAEPAGLDAIHLVLYHLTQEIAKEKGSRVSGIHKHPAKVNYHDMFKKLDIDHNNRVTRENFALVLRRQVGVGAHVTDADLALIFTEMDTDKSGALSFSEFAAYCKGAATPTIARGLAYEAEKKSRAPSSAPAPAPSS
ncbi:hypothetical protein SO694_00017349 [Aureococcus anophagefferens]|uniref:EF-hand domain-containing protein n=1 Tax=Aureococcus anophagefferens TaxID=44056 RepID=A0ABR1G1S5_AURAN